MTHSQKGESWSRGLPASCVMIVRDTSTVCRRSQITRYGESGFVACVRRGIHWASHADFVSRMRSVTAPDRPRALPWRRSLISTSRASRTRPASPISAWSARMSFERSAGSSVEWMIRFPFGIFTP